MVGILNSSFQPTPKFLKTLNFQFTLNRLDAGMQAVCQGDVCAQHEYLVLKTPNYFRG